MEIDAQLKQQLARELCSIMRGWPLYDAAEQLGTTPSQISELNHDKLERFSINRLLRYVSCLGYDVEVRLQTRPRPVIKPPQPKATVSRAAAGTP